MQNTQHICKDFENINESVYRTNLNYLMVFKDFNIFKDI